MVGLMHQRKLCGTIEASDGGRMRVRIIHGLNISHKELTYLLQEFINHRSKILIRMLLGDRLVRKDYRSFPTSTRKEDKQK